MKCPVDNTTLTIAERAGVEIDHCPECRGVWLDRGELDKIIERSEGDIRPQRESRDERSGHDRDRSDYKHDKGYGYDQRGGKRRKRESFLGDLFDF